MCGVKLPRPNRSIKKQKEGWDLLYFQNKNAFPWSYCHISDVSAMVLGVKNLPTLVTSIDLFWHKMHISWDEKPFWEGIRSRLELFFYWLEKFGEREREREGERENLIFAVKNSGFIKNICEHLRLQKNFLVVLLKGSRVRINLLSIANLKWFLPWDLFLY